MQETLRPLHELAVIDKSSAQTGAGEDTQQRTRALARAERVLAVRAGIHVVEHGDRALEERA